MSRQFIFRLLLLGTAFEVFIDTRLYLPYDLVWCSFDGLSVVLNDLQQLSVRRDRQAFCHRLLPMIDIFYQLDLSYILFKVGQLLRFQFCFPEPLVLEVLDLLSLCVLRWRGFHSRNYFLKNLQSDHQTAQNQSAPKDVVTGFLDNILLIFNDMTRRKRLLFIAHYLW